MHVIQWLVRLFLEALGYSLHAVGVQVHSKYREPTNKMVLVVEVL